MMGAGFAFFSFRPFGRSGIPRLLGPVPLAGCRPGFLLFVAFDVISAPVGLAVASFSISGECRPDLRSLGSVSAGSLLDCPSVSRESSTDSPALRGSQRSFDR